MTADDGEPHAEQMRAKLERIYREHWRFVWRSARKMGIPMGRVEDVVQDVFVVAGGRLHEFEGRSSIKTWLYAITFRVIQEHRRKIVREGRTDGVPTAEPATAPDDHVAKVEAAALLQRLLEDLDDDKRVVFVFAEIEQMPAAEIAEHVGVPVNTVYSRLRLARAQITKALGRHRAASQRAEGHAAPKRKATSAS